MSTFADVYRRVLLRCPGADPLLVRDWVQEAYRVACDDKVWSHQRAETAIIVDDQRRGTADVEQGSPVVLGGTLIFANTDIGRQVRVSSIPLYTLIDVDTVLNTATLDRPYAEADDTVQLTILDAYWTAPEDFWRFLAVVDPTNKWRLRWWVTEDQLNAIDPGRMSTGSPWCVASQRYSPVEADAGRARYEVYPYVTSARSFAVLYYTKPATLVEDDVLIGPFARGGDDTLIEGALWQAALWPGTGDLKNPYFSLPLAEQLEARFRAKVQTLENKDEDLYPTFMPSAMYYPWAPYPLDSAWLQGHVPQTIDAAW